MATTNPSEAVMEEGRSLWSDSWRRLRQNRLAVVCGVILLLMALAGFGSPLIAEYGTHFSYEEQHPRLAYLPPGTQDISLSYPTYDGDASAFDLVDLDGDGFLTCRKLPVPLGSVDRLIESTNLSKAGQTAVSSEELQKLHEALPLRKVLAARLGEWSCPEIDELNRLWRHYEFLFQNYDRAKGAAAPRADTMEPDSLVSWAEFPKRDEELKPAYRGRGLAGEAPFKVLDADGDGLLSLAEVTARTRYMRLDRLDLLANYDTDGDHRISRAEFPGAPGLHTFALGTDSKGRDVLTRVLYGGRISIIIGLVTTLIAFFIGVIYGSIAGFFGGRVDNIMMRIVDVLYGLPYLFIVILLLVIIGRNTINLFIALGCLNWLNMARIVRGQVISLKTREFVEAARAIGVSRMTIVFRHLIRNTVGPVVVYGTLLVPGVILQEAFLSFLGLGVQPPLPSWGNLITEGADKFADFGWLIIYPGLALAITLFAMNLLGDGVRDAMDPKMQKA